MNLSDVLCKQVAHTNGTQASEVQVRNRESNINRRR